MHSKFMRGVPLLDGSNTIPGHPLKKEEKEYFLKVLKACRDFGLNFYPTIVQKVSYDEMSEIASYGGFPKRYPHWKWGMEYEQLQRGYEYNQFRIFELVINSNPCVMYVLSSNTLLDNVVVVAHATGHNDFFKNNIFFNNTDTDAISTFGIHADIIKKYIDKFGYEKVTEFIDHVHRIETLIDPANLYQEKDYVKNSFNEENEDPIRTKVNINNHYMYSWFNNDKFLEKDINRIKKIEAEKELDIFKKEERDIFKFIIDNAPIKN